VAPRPIHGLLLRRSRRRTSRSPAEFAGDLGIELALLESYENGGEPVPHLVRLAARALEHRLEPLQEPPTDARDQWVDLVSDMLAYAREEPVISRLLLDPDRGRLRRFLDFLVTGPDKALALTDPALFRSLREACTRALVAGWGRYRVGTDGRVRRMRS